MKKDLWDYVDAALDSRWYIPCVAVLTLVAIVLPWLLR